MIQAQRVCLLVNDLSSKTRHLKQVHLNVSRMTHTLVPQREAIDKQIQVWSDVLSADLNAAVGKMFPRIPWSRTRALLQQATELYKCKRSFLHRAKDLEPGSRSEIDVPEDDFGQREVIHGDESPEKSASDEHVFEMQGGQIRVPGISEVSVPKVVTGVAHAPCIAVLNCLAVHVD